MTSDEDKRVVIAILHRTNLEEPMEIIESNRGTLGDQTTAQFLCGDSRKSCFV